MTLWQIITDNSTLPINPANNFWDHLNNQQGGGPITAIQVAGINVHLEPGYNVYIDDTEFSITQDANIDITLNAQEIDVFKDPNIEVAK